MNVKDPLSVALAYKELSAFPENPNDLKKKKKTFGVRLTQVQSSALLSILSLPKYVLGKFSEALFLSPLLLLKTLVIGFRTYPNKLRLSCLEILKLIIAAKILFSK